MNADRIVDDVAVEFGRKLQSLVADVDRELIGALGFQSFLKRLRSALNDVGREVVKDVLARKDELAGGVTRAGKLYRFKETVVKDWLTPFGQVCVSRRYFQRDLGGDGVFPLDEIVGMVDRFMTPDLEDMSAFAAGLLTPGEVEELLSKILLEAPSRKAIQRTVADVGEFIEQHEQTVFSAIRKQQPLSTEGDVLVASWDGTSVPLLPIDEGRSGDGSKAATGAKSKGSAAKLKWREAGVASISNYVRGDGDEVEPKRVDARYLARMPEAYMLGLNEQIESLPNWLLEPADYSEILVLADGKRAIWEDAKRIEWLRGARLVLDFYHAVQHVGVVGDALFGELSMAQKRWVDEYCHRLKHDMNGADSMIRSIRYYNMKNGLSRKATKVVRRELRYFARYREQMNYADLRRRGLPIGSGPVEGACKNIVGARLKRSGMRWSNRGGQQILNLRTHIKSGTWEIAWSTYLARKTA